MLLNNIPGKSSINHLNIQSMPTSNSPYSLGICIPVWNRGDLFKIALASLLKQLEGIDATIWIFDNGSNQETKDIIFNIGNDTSHRIINTFFPQNMGIPYAVNVFAKAIQEDCDYANYRAPKFVLIMDSDAYFKNPIVDLITIAEHYYDVGLVSGHDSIEHAPNKEAELNVNGRKVLVKEKSNERMISMLMRTEEFLHHCPFPHYRNRDVDWEIAQWGPNSLMRRNLKLVVACDYVLHLGIKSSTWNTSEQKFESDEEINEVRLILGENNNLLTDPVDQ